MTKAPSLALFRSAPASPENAARNALRVIFRVGAIRGVFPFAIHGSPENLTCDAIQGIA
jgi:hypothetical protein